MSEELTSQCYSHHRFGTPCLTALSLLRRIPQDFGETQEEGDNVDKQTRALACATSFYIKNWLHVTKGLPMLNILGSLQTRIKLKDDIAVDNRNSLFPSLLEPMKFRCSKARVSLKSHQHLKKQKAFSHW